MPLRTIFVALLATMIAHDLTAQTTVFSTSFDSGAPPELSGITDTEAVQSYSGIDCFAGNFLRNKSGCGPGSLPLAPTTLTLTQLPPHSTVSIQFLLAIIDTWDGLTPCCGPDYFEVCVDESQVFSASFKNAFGGGHPYAPPPGVLLAENIQLGFRSSNVNDQDSAFDMGNEPSLQGIPHTSSTLIVRWSAFGPGWHHTCAGANSDESWAIDNLSIVLDSVLGQPAIAVTTVGVGCAGSGAISPTLEMLALPSLGNPIMAVQVSQGAFNSTAYLYGAAGVTSSPISLGNSCNLYLEPVSLSALISAGVVPILQTTGASGTAIFMLPIPASVCPGFQFALQAAVTDPTTLLGVSVTNALNIVAL